MAAPSEEKIDENESRENLNGAYYAVLLVDRKATAAEINAAYKRLSLQFHPDKHITSETKKAAENLFHRIKRAKDVLSDPHLRAIYDAVGEEGLAEFERSQLVKRDMRSSREIIEEYERLLKIKRFYAELNSYNPYATTEVHLDMSSVFQSDYFVTDGDAEIGIIDQLSCVDIDRMKLQQGFTFPVGDKNHVAVDSSLLLNYGSRIQRGGSISGSWQSMLPFGLISNLRLVIGSNKQLTCSLSKRLTKHSTVNVSVSCDMVQNMLIPGGGCVYSHQLSKRLRAEVSGHMGLSESVKCQAYYTADTYSVIGSLQTGVSLMDTGSSPNAFSLQIIKKIDSQDLKLKIATMLTFSKYQLQLKVFKQIPSREMQFSTALLLDSDMGVSLNLSLRRGRQKYIFPIQLSDKIEPAATAYGLLLPVLAYTAVKALLIFPYLRKQRELKLEKKKEEEKENLERRRLAAAEEVELMSAAVLQIVSQEEEKSGLIIVKALYGKLHLTDDKSPNSEDCVINVTIPLQHQVRDSTLKMTSDISKVEMPGFYDPCYGEPKSLYVRYKFHGKLHHVTVADNELLAIPKPGHLMSASAGS